MLGSVLTVRGGTTLTRAPTTPQLRQQVQDRRDGGWCSRCGTGARSAAPAAALFARHLTHWSPRRIAVYELTRRAAARVVQCAMAQAKGAIDISHVCKLTRAARKHDFGGHCERAVELYERAVAAAEALRQPDCLIVARIRCWCLDTQYRVIASSLLGDDSVDAWRRAAGQALAVFQAHLPGVLETLERRRAAGTLLPGRCRAYEVACGADCVRTDPRLSGEPEPDDGCISHSAQHVGVSAFFAAARLVPLALRPCTVPGVVPDEPLLGRCLNYSWAPSARCCCRI